MRRAWWYYCTRYAWIPSIHWRYSEDRFGYSFSEMCATLVDPAHSCLYFVGVHGACIMSEVTEVSHGCSSPSASLSWFCFFFLLSFSLSSILIFLPSGRSRWHITVSTISFFIYRTSCRFIRCYEQNRGKNEYYSCNVRKYVWNKCLNCTLKI